MATAHTTTLMPLDEFAKIIGLHPLHFNQIDNDGNGRWVGGCAKTWLSYDWQAPSATSRESVARALSSAELLLEEYLGFATRPKWFADFELPIINPLAVLPRGYYITGGIRTVDLIEAGSTITYSDEDADGFDETATVSVATSVTETDEITVFYPGENEDWSIRPLRVTISSGTATIKFDRSSCVLKDKLEALHPTSIDGTDDNNFLEEVDVYRIWNDPSQQCILKSRQSCMSCLNGCDSCTYSEDEACLSVDNRKSSIVNISAAIWNGTSFDKTVCFNKDVYAGRFWFKAGWRENPIWEQAVAYLAMTQLDAALCDCAMVQERMKYWTQDLARVDGAGYFRLPNGGNPSWVFDCPWGTQRGAVYAYSIARKHKLPQGM